LQKRERDEQSMVRGERTRLLARPKFGSLQEFDKLACPVEALGLMNVNAEGFH
jgi:hypothetical protein